MKTKLLIFALGMGLTFSACNGKQADEKNADEMNQYTDSTTHRDSLSADTTHDKTTNAPADAGTEKNSPFSIGVDMALSCKRLGVILF